MPAARSVAGDGRFREAEIITGFGARRVGRRERSRDEGGTEGAQPGPRGTGPGRGRLGGTGAADAVPAGERPGRGRLGRPAPAVAAAGGDRRERWLHERAPAAGTSAIVPRTSRPRRTPWQLRDAVTSALNSTG